MTTATVIPIRREFQVHRFNAGKHGVLSRHIVLPWEDAEAYEEILRGLLIEHAPQGPTAFHLVEDLACTIWRKRRLLQAEAARVRDEFHDVTRGYSSEKLDAKALTFQNTRLRGSLIGHVTQSAPGPDAQREALAMIERARKALKPGTKAAFSAALKQLDEVTLKWWQDQIVDPEDEESGGFTDSAAGLGEFLSYASEQIEARQIDAANAPAVADHAQGMAVDLRPLAEIAKIEAHLDRKLQGLLAALGSLKKRNQTG